jgi:tetratricopeptide (TPR) repeat protein
MGTCDEDLAVPYQPFVEGLRDLVTACPAEVLVEALGERGGELIRLLPELARRVPDLPPPQGGDPETERYLLFSAVVELLAGVSRWRPVLLLLDDLHWATKPTLLVLRHLIRYREPVALLVVGTYRDSDIGRGHPFSELLADSRRESGIERLALRGLSDTESITLMEALAGQDLDGTLLDLAHAVYAEADGSPFFMRELIRHFVEAGELIQEGDRWTYQGELSTLGIPDSVREVIGHRISRLPDPTDRLLRLGAVIGREFDLAVLAPVAGLDRAAVAEALEAAGRAALVREVKGSPGRFSFAHALVRHTIYDELGPAQRMELHRRVAETFESLGQDDAYLSELALHWAAATPGAGVVVEDRAKAAAYAQRAGARAMGSLAYEEAVHHFEDALRTVRPGGDQIRVCDLLIALGEAQRCAGDPVHRETLLEAGRLAHEVADPERAARAALANQRGAFSRVGTIDPERVAALEAALGAIDPAATPVRARLLAALATELHFAGDERRLQLGREALSLARQTHDPAALAQVLAAVWFATWGPASLTERLPMVAELGELAGRLEDRTYELHAGLAVFLTASEAADMERADTGLAACARVAEELGQPLLRWRTIHLQTHRAIAAGRFDDVERLAVEGLHLGEAIGQPDARAFLTGSLGLVRILQGRPEDAAELLSPAVQRFPVMWYAAALAWARAEEGRVDEAAAMLADLRADLAAGLARDYLRLASLCALTRTAHRLADTAAAHDLHGLLLPHGAGMAVAQNVWIGPVTHDLALLETVLGRYDAADEHFATAVDIQDRIGARGTVIHSRLEWAAMLLQRDHGEDRDRARLLLDQARAGCREVGLPRIEARIAELG